MGLGSWLSGLFGSTAAAPAAQEVTQYKGYQIQPAPQPEGAQFRTAGFIRKPAAAEGEDEQVHHLIRADVHSSLDQAVEHTLFKAKQVIDQQGERIFETLPD